MKQVNHDIIITIALIFATFLAVTVIMNSRCEAQTVKIFSPSLSVRDAKLSPDLPYDYQVSITFWQIGSNWCYIELERENGQFYRNREFRLQAFGIYFQDKQYTARDIWITEFGYVYRYRDSPLKMGGSLVFDNWGQSNKVAVVEYAGKRLFMRYLRGQKKWILDANFAVGAPFRRELFKFGSFSFQPAWELLFKWYQDDRNKFRQFKISFMILFEY